MAGIALGVLVAGLLLPGAGLALALVLLLGPLRPHRTFALVLVGLGAALLLGQVGLLPAWSSHSNSSVPAHLG